MGKKKRRRKESAILPKDVSNQLVFVQHRAIDCYIDQLGVSYVAPAFIDGRFVTTPSRLGYHALVGLYLFDRQLTGTQVQEFLSAEELRMTTLEEFFSLGVDCPEIRTKMTIVTMSAWARGHGGSLLYPCFSYQDFADGVSTQLGTIDEDIKNGLPDNVRYALVDNG